MQSIDLNAETSSLDEIITQTWRLTDAPILPIELCASLCEAPSYRANHVDSSELQFVVGDSANAFTYAWNREPCLGNRRHQYAVWVSEALVGSPLIADYLSRVAKQNSVGSNSSRCRLLYSESSVVVPGFGELVQRLRSEFGSSFADEPLKPVPVYLPNQPIDLPRWVAGLTDRSVAFADRRGVMPSPLPPFVLRAETGDRWMTDVGLQNLTDVDGPDRYWGIPQRQHLTQFFASPYESGRILRNGIASVETGSEKPSLEVRIPDPRVLAQHMLLSSPHRGKLADGRAVVTNVQISSSGKHLSSVLRLFGGLVSAGYALRNPFWRRIFAELAGSRRERRVKLREVLLMGLEPIVGTPDDALVDALADKVAQTGFGEPQPFLNRKELREKFGRIRSQFKDTSEEKEWWARFEHWSDDRDRELIEFIDRGVLRQGTSLRCHDCGLTSWLNLSEISRAVACVGCGAIPRLIFPEIAIRLNEKLADAIASDLEYVVRALDEIRTPVLGSFVVFPSYDVFMNGSAEPLTDLDIVCISEGRLEIGEVKSRLEGFTDKVLNSLALAAEAIRPDVLVLAAGSHREDGEDGLCQELAARARRRFSHLRCRVSVRLLKSGW